MWKKELDEIFYEMIKNIMRETSYWFWARTNEELVNIQLFYSAIRKELDDLEELENYLVIIQREALNFDWPDDAAYNEWKNQFLVKISKDEEEEDAKVKVTLIVSNEDMENPQINVNL